MLTANVAGQKPDGTVVANAFGLTGRVVVVADRPLLEANFSTNSQREVVIYAPTPSTNVLQYVTHIRHDKHFNHGRQQCPVGVVCSKRHRTEPWEHYKQPCLFPSCTRSLSLDSD
jgi:hypothetical protein